MVVSIELHAPYCLLATTRRAQKSRMEHLKPTFTHCFNATKLPTLHNLSTNVTKCIITYEIGNDGAICLLAI